MSHQALAIDIKLITFRFAAEDWMVIENDAGFL